jgi:outer membrane protein assembly factor BamE (lipoprotein component of BamABCDE complex)
VYEAHAGPLSQSAGALPPPLSTRLEVGSSRFQVDAILGVPTKTVGNISLYGYVSSSNERKVMVAYFDMSGRLERFARYALKDWQVVDEIKQSELSDGAELPAVRSLLSASSSVH